ncbi:MAG: efflux RND transporter periplasmic adaptor subunit [Nitrospirota bacterium]
MLPACKKEPKQPPPPPEVSVIMVKPQRVALTMELPGRTSAHLLAEVRPQVNGVIQNRLFTEGSDVKAGDILYQIDPAMYQAAYNNAKATLARAEANIIPAQLKAQRFEELIKIQAVSRQDYENATAALKQAAADVESARAALETARINLAYTRVAAPISGRIGRSSVTTGALVTASQPSALATIQQLDPIYVDVTQSSSEMLRLKQALASGQLKKSGRTGAKVKLLLENGIPYSLEGTLKFSEVTVDQSTDSITLRTVFPNPRHTLLPGMFVRAVIHEGIAEKGILIPQQGVNRNPKGESIALVVDDAGTVQQRLLILDRAIGDQWLVVSGLSSGDRLIVEGMQKVRPGTTVKTVPFIENKTAAAATSGSEVQTKKQSKKQKDGVK